MLPRDDLRNHFPSKPPVSDIEAFTGAARDGNTAEVLRLLNEHGANIINERDTINARALTWAACNGHLDIVELLLDRGAAIDAQGTIGKAALSWAVEMNKPEIVSLLLDRGASLETRDDGGSTPLDYARRHWNNDLTAMLEEHLEAKQQAEQRRVQEQKETETRNLTMERLEKLRKSRPGNLKLPPAPTHPAGKAPDSGKPAPGKRQGPKHPHPGH